jgi:impB/mucB/samB family C-terminal domain
VDFGRKSFGNTYALGKQTNDPKELAKLLMKLCEKTGRRLRKAKYAGQGVHVSCVYTDFSFWHTSRKVHVPVYTTREIYLKALWLLWSRSGGNRPGWGDAEAKQYDPLTNCFTIKTWNKLEYRVKKGEKAIRSITYVMIVLRNSNTAITDAAAIAQVFQDLLRLEDTILLMGSLNRWHFQA